MFQQQKIIEYIGAGFSGIWLTTFEAEEVEQSLEKTCSEKGWSLLTWDIAQGGKTLQGNARFNASEQKPPQDPRYPFNVITNENPNSATIVLLHNFHAFLETISVAQTMANALIEGKALGIHYVVLTHEQSPPTILEKRFVTLSHNLPDKEELTKIASELTEEISEPSVTAARGLTRMEAENAFSLSIYSKGKLVPTVVNDLKKEMIRKTECLSMYEGGESFKDIGGLEHLKSFSLNLIQSKRQDIPTKGLILNGVPGTGKSLFAKALGSETHRPTFLMDVGAAYHKHVGETEQRIRRALATLDAVGNCVVLIDEVEKALSGSSGDGDSGVASRLFGTLLSWLNDKSSGAFVICTSNDLSKLPTELKRPGRFDACFFVDFPNQEEKEKIWEVHTQKYGLKNPKVKDLNDDRWTGAEIENCCRLAALLGTSLEEQAKLVMPLSVSDAERVAECRKQCNGRFLSATYPEVFRVDRFEAPAKKQRRKVMNNGGED